MEGRLEERETTMLAGLSFFGNPFAQSPGWTEENEIGHLWSRLMRLRADDPHSFPPPLVPDQMFELHLPDHRTNETGEYEVFVGYPVADPAAIPLPLVAKVVPGGRVARFTLRGSTIVGGDSYAEMYEWMAARQLTPTEWMFNLYDSRFKGMDRLEESALDVCIPIQDAEDAG